MAGGTIILEKITPFMTERPFTLRAQMYPDNTNTMPYSKESKIRGILLVCYPSRLSYWYLEIQKLNGGSIIHFYSILYIVTSWKDHKTQNTGQLKFTCFQLLLSLNQLIFPINIQMRSVELFVDLTVDCGKEYFKNKSKWVESIDEKLHKPFKMKSGK